MDEQIIKKAMEAAYPHVKWHGEYPAYLRAELEAAYVVFEQHLRAKHAEEVLAIIREVLKDGGSPFFLGEIIDEIKLRFLAPEAKERVTVDRRLEDATHE